MFVRFLIGLAVLLLSFTAALVRMTQVVDGDLNGDPPPLAEEQAGLVALLDEYVRHQANVIGQRNHTRMGSLTATEEYLTEQLRIHDLDVQRETFQASGKEVANLVVEVPGTARPDELIVVGAHYDSYARSPSANATASGVACLIETAARVAASRPARTVRFVLFAMGEYPYEGTAESGAVVHVANLQAKGEQVVAALMLGSLGCWSDAAGSQKFPFPTELCYPESGDFLAVWGVGGSRSLVQRTGDALRSVGTVPVRGGSLPTWWPGMTARGDHNAFADAGWDTVLISDTGSARDPLLRTPSDGAQRVDATQLARVTLALSHAVRTLANGTD